MQTAPTPDGGLLSWRLTTPPEWAGRRRAVPHRLGSTTPSVDHQRAGASLLRVEHRLPEPDRVGAVLAAIGISVPVTHADAPTLQAVITGPAGSMLLTG